MDDQPDDLTLRRLRDLRRRYDDLRDSFDFLFDRLQVLERRIGDGGADAASVAAFVTSLERRVRRLEERADLHDE